MNGPTSTSRQSYYKHVVTGKARSQRQCILDFLEQHHIPANRRQISVMTGIAINAVCGRVNALIENGDVVVAYVAEDPITEKRVEWLEIPPKQLKLHLR